MNQDPDKFFAFTVDVEDWFHGIELPKSEWSMCEKRLMIGMERLLDLCKELNINGTFFILGRIAEEYPSLVREIADAGHELGIHGKEHDKIYEMSPKTFREDLLRTKELIESQGGTRVVGYRAPYFSITSRSLWALTILIEEGFIYDSSIFPVRNWRYGIPNAPLQPHLIKVADGEILEFPMSVFKILNRTFGFSGGFYLRFWPLAILKLLSLRVMKQGRPVIIYIHPWELDPEHPRVHLPWKIRKTHYFGLCSSYNKLKALLKWKGGKPLKEWLPVRESYAK